MELPPTDSRAFMSADEKYISMASNVSDPPGDPAADGNYDYTSDDVERPGLVDDLETVVDGDVRFDSYTRQLYATDASAYEATPVGVVLPRSTADVAAVMQYCAEREIPVLPRGGGTSLAGQAVNEAVVLDFTKYLTDIEQIDPGERTVTVEAGVCLDDLNAELAPHGLKFAPDPAAGDRSALGGAIGNNSTGAHSPKYGKTDVYIEEVEAVLADGSVARFGEIAIEQLREKANPEAEDALPRIYAEVLRIIDEEAEEVQKRYPRLKRNVSGYNLDMLVDEAEDGTVNLGRLLAGSEGTLAIVTEATVTLEEVPNTKSVALLTYESLIDAVRDVAPVLKHGPAAVELIDDTLLSLARETTEFAEVVGMLPEGTESALLIEFYAEDTADGMQKVADLIADRVPGESAAVSPREDAESVTDTPEAAAGALEAYDADKRAKIWKLRKSGLPILLSRTGDEKHISFIEDCAIPPEKLPEYVADFQTVLEEYDTFASFYAHAGPGVLHVRPLVNVKSIDGLEDMEAIADAVTDLVVKYGGSVSGEHGDGRARTQWNRKLYGDRLWSAFRDLKTAYDPDWLLNPGNVCGDHDMTENHRHGPAYEFKAGFESSLNWENENGFQGMVELCHGCGGCRSKQETSGGVMCPTYRAAEEEMQSTRGRANMLRQAMSGDLPDDEVFSDQFVEEVMDLCIGCKGCAKDCPSEVDMAKMKAEVTHEYHQRNGSSLRDKLFANIHDLSQVGSTLAPLSNLGTKLPGARWLMEKTVGIAADRTLPEFHSQSLRDWFDDRGGAAVPESEAERRVVLFPDTHSTYNRPDIGRAAIRLLEAADVHVAFPEVGGSGRPPFSKGFIDKARSIAQRNVTALAPAVRDGWDVVVTEPSDAVMLQSDYLDLLEGEDAEAVAANTYGVLEYVDALRLDDHINFEDVDQSVTYHGHCHQKAVKKDHHAVGVLRRAGYEVDPLDSGCCGMAGSFGYESEHFSMSNAIGEILFDQVDDSSADTVVAPGASCRTQLGDRDNGSEEPDHPVQKIADVIAA